MSIIAGFAILALLSGFIVAFIETLLKIIAVFVGMALIVVGVVLVVGGRWIGRRWRWGPPTSST